MFCSNCGTRLPDDSRFCTACGKATEGLPPQAYAPPKKEAAFAYAPPQASDAPGQGPGKSRRADAALIVTIAGLAVSLLSMGAYFMFFAGGPAPEKRRSDPPAVAAAITAAPTDQAAVLPTQQPAVQPETAAETVSNQTITLDMAYDSGEGTYTGEVNGAGMPHGRGSFTMQKSKNGWSWSYEGQWENGEITGQGVKKQGAFASTGTFRGGLLNGNGEITDDGILRYKGMWADGRLHGQGTLYTKSGTLIFEGTFENDMLVESEADRKRRGEAFMPECEDMDEMIYDGCMAEDNLFDHPVHVWGFPLGMSEQTQSGTIIIGHFADDSYPVCLLYRYTVGEPKITGDDWISAWGVVTGLFEYTDANGKKAICPQVEVIYWDDEQEGP